jgi:hypothetical protein
LVSPSLISKAIKAKSSVILIALEEFIIARVIDQKKWEWSLHRSLLSYWQIWFSEYTAIHSWTCTVLKKAFLEETRIAFISTHLACSMYHILFLLNSRYYNSLILQLIKLRVKVTFLKTHSLLVIKTRVELRLFGSRFFLALCNCTKMPLPAERFQHRSITM